MYKIYINEGCLVIGPAQNSQNIEYQHFMKLPYLSGKKALHAVIDKLEKSPPSTSIYLVSNESRETFTTFKSLYKRIDASGGIIFNKAQQILFIKRLDRWDLPKGKVDPEETMQQAAIREVHEETGLQCQLVEKLGKTWHTYFDSRHRRILKKTVWFVMAAPDKPLVQIQEDEHITDHVWMTAGEFLNSRLPSYQSIRSIVNMLPKQ